MREVATDKLLRSALEIGLADAFHAINRLLEVEQPEFVVDLG